MKQKSIEDIKRATMLNEFLITRSERIISMGILIAIFATTIHMHINLRHIRNVIEQELQR